MTWRERFGMQAPPLPRGAVGESFFEGDPHYQRLAQAFAWLASEPGIGVLTGEPGVGKTSAIRHLCRALPASEHRVVYLCDCAVKPLDLDRIHQGDLADPPWQRGGSTMFCVVRRQRSGVALARKSHQHQEFRPHFLG